MTAALKAASLNKLTETAHKTYCIIQGDSFGTRPKKM
jgi:hypothetical protein